MARARPPSLRLLGDRDADRHHALVATHTNRFGVAYYLHEGRTKTGRPRFFVRKTIAEGALAALPEGFEFSESINGIVSVRRVRAESPIDPADVELVRSELARHAHLERHRIEVRDDAIVIHEPVGMTGVEFAQFARMQGRDPEPLRRRMTPKRFAPVMEFRRAEPGASIYVARRMTYRGEGGWLALDAGPLRKLIRYLRAIDTDEFFELF